MLHDLDKLNRNKAEALEQLGALSVRLRELVQLLRTLRELAKQNPAMSESINRQALEVWNQFAQAEVKHLRAKQALKQAKALLDRKSRK
jgi:hypothetical protein